MQAAPSAREMSAARRVEAVVGGRLPEEDELHYLSAVLYAYRHAA